MPNDRPLRDRLGEFCREQWYQHYSLTKEHSWDDLPEYSREDWRKHGDKLPELALSVGLTIEVKDD